MLKIRQGLCGALFILGIIMLDPHMSTGQPGGGQPGGGFGRGGGAPGGGAPGGGGFGGGGRPGGGGGGFTDPEKVFGFYARGADVIDFSRMDPNMKNFAKSGFEKMGMPVPSDNTVITKAQFTESFTRALAAKGMTPTTSGPAGGFGAAPGGGGFGPPGGGGYGGKSFGPPGGGGQTMTMTFTPGNGGGFGPPGGGGYGAPGGGGFGPPGGGFGGKGFGPPGGGFGNQQGGDKGGGDKSFRMTDQDIERRFADSDANRDGKLAYDEVSDRSPLKASFKETDTNGDGYIDLTEYKAYIAARFGGGEGDPNAGSYGSYAGNGNYGRDGRREEKKEEVQVAIRYGKLPTGLPNWWDSLDTDKDGQIGLYEWRADGRDMKEFQKMDLDGDGILAPQEWLRFNVLSAEQAKAIAAEEEIGGTGGSTKTGGRPSFGGGGNTGSGGGNKNWPGMGKGSDTSKGSDSSKGSDTPRSDKGGSNPFREGGKKGK